MLHRHAWRAAVVALAFTGACDVPTSVPNWQQTWNVPAKSTTISVGTLLPSGVSIAPDSSAFAVDVSPATVTRQLGQDCGACAAANGLVVPKPPFTMTASSTAPIPGSVASATLVRDTLTLTIQNGLDFDPLRPGGGATGYLVTTITSGGTVLGRDSVDGAVQGMPAGQTFVRKIPLSGNASGSSGLQVSATLNSPQGDPVLMNSSETVTVTGSVGTFLVSSAQVKVQNQSISASPISFDLTSISGSVKSRVQSGTLYLAITNPFAVQGTLTLQATGQANGGPYTIVKPISLSGAASSNVSVSFTTSEIAQLLGSDVTMQIAGSVSGPSGMVTVTPKQAVGVSTRFEVVVSTKSNP